MCPHNQLDTRLRWCYDLFGDHVLVDRGRYSYPFQNVCFLARFHTEIGTGCLYDGTTRRTSSPSGEMSGRKFLKDLLLVSARRWSEPELIAAVNVRCRQRTSPYPSLRAARRRCC